MNREVATTQSGAEEMRNPISFIDPRAKLPRVPWTSVRSVFWVSESGNKDTENISYQQIYWRQQWSCCVGFVLLVNLNLSQRGKHVICNSSYDLGFQDWYLTKIYCHERGEMILVWSGMRSGTSLCCCMSPFCINKKEHRTWLCLLGNSEL